MTTVLNHIALLTASIEKTVEKLVLVDADLSLIEEFESEGTRELYIGGADQTGHLLLMQAIADGPYQSSLKRRGEGLHHIAIDVENIEAFTKSICRSGWFLLPESLEFLKKSKQIWLARPGVNTLIEVNEAKSKKQSSYIEEVNLLAPKENLSLVAALACGLINTAAEQTNIKIAGRNIII